MDSSSRNRLWWGSRREPQISTTGINSISVPRTNNSSSPSELVLMVKWEEARWPIKWRRECLENRERDNMKCRWCRIKWTLASWITGYKSKQPWVKLGWAFSAWWTILSSRQPSSRVPTSSSARRMLARLVIIDRCQRIWNNNNWNSAQSRWEAPTLVNSHQEGRPTAATFLLR